MPTSLRVPDFQVAGEGDTTVFLLHGAYGSKDYFQHEIATLVGAGLRVVAWDAPGYGLSPLPAEGLTIESMAEACGRLIDLMGTARNVLLGHSMGGIIAPAVCLARPGRVHALAISATLASFSEQTEEQKRTFLAERIDPIARGASFKDTAAPVVASMFAPGSSGPLVERVREVALSTSKDTFVTAIRAIVHYEGTETLRRIRVPTLLLAGHHDKVGRPESMRDIQRRFVPHAQYQEMPHSGHYAFAEQPELFNQHLLDFIGQHLKP
jgi:pimeloyl-ACP methyl ester carboxylesterase